MHQWSIHTSLPPHLLSEPPLSRWILRLWLWNSVTAPATSGFQNRSFFDNCWGIGEPPPNDLHLWHIA